MSPRGGIFFNILSKRVRGFRRASGVSDGNFNLEIRYHWYNATAKLFKKTLCTVNVDSKC